MQSEAEVKAQKQQLAKKVTSSSPPKPSMPVPSEATTGSTQQRSMTTEHSSQPVASPDGLRQRSVGVASSESTSGTVTNADTSSNSNNFSSMVSPATRQSNIQSADALTPVPSRGWGSLLLMWVLLITIALLVARRIFVTLYGQSTSQNNV